MGKTTTAFFALALGAGALPMANPALAATANPVSPAIYSAMLQYEDQNGPYGASYAHPGSFVGPGTTASLSAFPNPSVSASSDAAPGAVADAQSTITYYFRVNGAPGMDIPILVNGSETVSTCYYCQSEVQLKLQSVNDASTYDVLSLSGNNDGHRNFVTSVNTYTNSEVTVFLGASSSAGGNGGIGSAFLDPVITIDPAFAAIDPNYLQDYSISLSPGVGNSAAVPEPATWAVMLVGLGGLGVVMRSRRKQQGTIAAV